MCISHDFVLSVLFLKCCLRLLNTESFRSAYEDAVLEFYFVPFVIISFYFQMFLEKSYERHLLKIVIVLTNCGYSYLDCFQLP